MSLFRRGTITVALAAFAVALTATGVAMASEALPHSHGAGGHHDADERIDGDKHTHGVAGHHTAADPARGLVYKGLIARKSGPCKGLFELANHPGMCTHGPDPAPSGVDVRRPVKPRPRGLAAPKVVCEGDGKKGNRVEVLYVHEKGQPDRYNEYLSRFRTWAAEVDEIYRASAAQTGGVRRVRFVTDGPCNVVVRNVSVDPGKTADYYSSLEAVEAQGFNRQDRKYLMFVDRVKPDPGPDPYAGVCGMGNGFDDDQPGQANANNSGHLYAWVICWTTVEEEQWVVAAAAHELTHTMGAVSSTSPNHSAYGHCTDGHDLMCYDDDGDGAETVLRIICEDKREERVLDCNKDDYFSTNPKPGSWLSKHWNTANNRFLITKNPTR